MELNVLITHIQQETPTVKSFLLDLGTEEFTFLPGQWIDLYIERPVEEALIGGFTLVSSPTRRGVIELAIKGQGGGAAAAYMHDYVRVGDGLWISGPGGKFYFQDGMADSLVLIAGGIGINPLMCMVRYIDAKGLKVRMTLLYSAKTPSEFLFHDELRAIEARNPLLRCYLTVTQPGQEPWEGRTGRIDEKMLNEVLPEGRPLYYMCGPRGMPSQMDELLKSRGVEVGTIQLEEW